MSSFSGHLTIEAGPVGEGRTGLVHQSFRAPFHIGKSYWDGQVLQVRVVNPTAGILSGDRLALDVRSAEGAALLVLTPAATRAFMMKSGVAECRQSFSVASGAWLEFAPEPLFPHRDSDYLQATRLEVAPDGELYFADALAPGRVGLGETWAWRRLRIGLELWVGGEPLLFEWFDGDGASLARMAAFHGMTEAWFGTVVAVSPRLEPGDPAWERIRALHGGGRWVGVTRLRPGVWIIRIVAPASLSLRDALSETRLALSGALPSLRSDLRRL